MKTDVVSVVMFNPQDSVADAARTLDKWMSAGEIDADFTACDTALLNRFFAEYLRAHTQGGTNTLQRNLAHLFAFLDEVYDHLMRLMQDTLDALAAERRLPLLG